MTQDSIDAAIRQRIRGLRLSRGLSLDAVAARCFLSPSTLSRIETGQRRIALDQLVPIARALDTTLEQLLDPAGDDDVVIHPQATTSRGRTTWVLSRERAMNGVSVAKMRIEPGGWESGGSLRVHPGREWFTVLSGVVMLRLGERTMLVHPGDAAEFSTMTPHSIEPHGGPVEILTIFDRDGEIAHLRSRSSEGAD
ncbi:helix-turn-helix domain-containing protein [Herbiconiux sp. L3-i23]|uniref:helix-turn-helix domain-containing protein n=1 Tax=Herbiconiux sp. L3-i23 TaxID=2905871 RepID=UPI002060A84A|nr:XRE family transcriptional regulator [Herbiconiux sp. L3-i23]BDI22277.1 transcriptional regulator [Herbiconiux sp. L3-i23]